MRRAALPVVALIAVLALVSGPPTGAATSDLQRKTGRSGYGVSDQQISVLGFDDMHPYNSLQVYGTDSTGTSISSLADNFVFPHLQGSINALVPNGARIQLMCLYGVDSDPDEGGDMTLSLERVVVDANNGANPAKETLATVQSDGGAGDGIWCADLPDIPIVYQFDSDGDGMTEIMTYSLRVDFPIYSLGEYAGFRMALLAWRRQISPDPAGATFPDVPVGSPYHRWVEAVAAAGIMGGCAPDRAGLQAAPQVTPEAIPATPSGNFCPDNPVTRAQLAVFLARALGLHWPAFGIGQVP